MKSYNSTFIQVAVLHYSPARFTGEVLNVGLLAFDPVTKAFLFKHPAKLQRISCAYGEYEGKRVRHLLMALSKAAATLSASGLLGPESPTSSLAEWISQVVPDQSSSAFFGPQDVIFREDFVADVNSYYASMVGRYYEDDEDIDRRDDKALYREAVESQIRKMKVPLPVQSEVFSNGKTRIRVSNSIRMNDHYVGIEAFSADYAKVERIDSRVDSIIGRDTQLQRIENFGVNYIVFGQPLANRSDEVHRAATAACEEILEITKKVKIITESEVLQTLAYIESNILRVNPESRDIDMQTKY